MCQQVRACSSTHTLSVTSLDGRGWISLPEGDHIGRTFKKFVPWDALLGHNLYAEWCPCALCAEVLRHVITEAAALCDCGRAVMCVQQGGIRDTGFDYQLLMSNCRYIHRQHHEGLHKALSNVALELSGPTVFPNVSFCGVFKPYIVIVLK